MPGWAEALVGPVPEVARRLLGARLHHGDVTVRITEVEAYDGPNDPASHAYRGSTARTEVMFGPPGHLYVYFSYGMHWCANVVTGEDGRGSAVLLRAGEVVAGIELARTRRGAKVPDVRLARGPANLAQSLGLDRSSNGLSLEDRLDLPAGVAASVLSGPRVGVSQAADVPWRFWLAGEPTVSAYRRSPRAPAGSR
ncbi:DNA-3-methyladenine glycosylase [Nocardioides mesophilus]|uniref:Putative 3-methyladenine DNA glycosylase n=1 Tax=Nocardioides mesophilus TaxID=433659 RepID=A0A7G9RAI0_9ACTN|nr:DNA-3-methyladenine glycosylase [Nocardioides mesophilus]QNN52605.1 DNA-3-methyladenine glycosylase [Nocardioides mesophilus]